ncbi:LOB domain-containing protein 25 [Lactuca sativa]|uniref:LOB domain-containing protein 25 n=1 Tax=Lactuca sativa TaxID=4236 RepID=UPI000CB1709A|nr:LOB domain-containing protein 25 [Lactuca sativa]XP_052625495.1 LOB domain-containing protein 25 [Lactuca sativa]
MASSSSCNSPCAACKFLRRKCMPGCTFAPYFPPEDPQKFVNVHKLFGASNVTKLLSEVQPHQREDVVNSLSYEAEARVRDPVYGCVGIISILQRQIDVLQKDLDAAKADLMRYARNATPVMPHLSSIQPATSQHRTIDHFSAKRIGGLYQPPPPFPNPYANRQWNSYNSFNSRENLSGGGSGGAGGGVSGEGNI